MTRKKKGIKRGSLPPGLHMAKRLKAGQDSKAETHVSSSSCRLLWCSCVLRHSKSECRCSSSSCCFWLQLEQRTMAQFSSVFSSAWGLSFRSVTQSNRGNIDVDIDVGLGFIFSLNQHVSGWTAWGTPSYRGGSGPVKEWIHANLTGGTDSLIDISYLSW